MLRKLCGVIGFSAVGLAALIAGACGSQVMDGGAAVGVDGLPIVPDRTPYDEGWRWESSAGIELAVPDNWLVNDTDCNQTSAPSVVRAQGFVHACLTPEPASKEIVEFGPVDPFGQDRQPPADFPKEEVEIDGSPVDRFEGQLADGRAAGWLHFTDRDLRVEARVRDREFLHHVFDSVRLVMVDTNGCATDRRSMKPKAPRAKTLLPAGATEVSICHFDQDRALRTSALLEGAQASALIALLNRAARGHNPDAPRDECSEDTPYLADTIVIARGQGDGALVEVYFSGCKRRGLRNGRTNAQLTIPMLDALLRPVGTSFGYHPVGLE